jgi:hypothetical protein
VNARGAPQRVRRGHLADQRADLAIDGRATVSSSRAPSPAPSEPLAMSPDDSIGLDEHQGPAPVAPGIGHQDTRSRVRRRGRLTVRCKARSCCLSAMFSRTNSRCPRQASATARAINKIISSTLLWCRGSIAKIKRGSGSRSSGEAQPSTSPLGPSLPARTRRRDTTSSLLSSVVSQPLSKRTDPCSRERSDHVLPTLKITMVDTPSSGVIIDS